MNERTFLRQHNSYVGGVVWDSVSSDSAGYGSTESSSEPQQLRFDVDILGFSIVEYLSLDHNVYWLMQTIQDRYNRMYTYQRNLPNAYAKKIFCVELDCELQPEDELSHCFSKFIREGRVKIIVEMSTVESESDSEENETVGRGHSRPPSSSRSESADTATADAITDASTPATVPQGNGITNESRRYTIEDQRLFYWISRLSFLWKSPSDESRTIKCSRYLGQGSLTLLALYYISYVVYNPFLDPPGLSFSFNTTNVVNMYFVVQGLRYLVIYGLGIWLCAISHIHHVIKKSFLHSIGQDEEFEWNQVNKFLFKRAFISIILILLPALTVIPALSGHYDGCSHNLKLDTRNLVSITVPIELVGYVLFCFITLPVFLTVLCIAKIHVAELRTFSRRMLAWRGDNAKDAEDLVRKIQGAVRYSSDRLHTILSVYYFVMILWMNTCGWIAVDKWIVLRSSKYQYQNCWMPADAARYTIITVTQFLCFYIYPLYYFAKLPRILKRLVADIATVDCETQAANGYLLRTYKLRKRMTNVISTGLKHEPRFVVFWCIPISEFGAVLLVCFTPILPVVWNSILAS